ncbi:MAG: UbiA family prenyltransferase [Candidatus Thermoplasmatota archaeon]
MSGYLAMARPVNCLLGAAATFVAFGIVHGFTEIQHWEFQRLALAMVIVGTFMAAGNALNDFFDRWTDRISHPSRPIPSGRVSPRGALLFATALFCLDAVLAPFLSPLGALIAYVSMVIMVGYELKAKSAGLAGNLSIAWLTASLFLFGGFAAVHPEPLKAALTAGILGMLAFLSTAGREVVKDIQDLAGDRGARATLPMRIGRARAGMIAAVFFLAAVVLSPLPYLSGELGAWYLVIVGAADAIFIYSAAIGARSPARSAASAKCAMAVALVAFVLGGISP